MGGKQDHQISNVYMLFSLILVSFSEARNIPSKLISITCCLHVISEYFEKKLNSMDSEWLGTILISSAIDYMMVRRWRK